MPFYLVWIFSNFIHWNFRFFSISDLSYGANQDFMLFILAQFFVARYPQKLHSVKITVCLNHSLITFIQIRAIISVPELKQIKRINLAKALKVKKL